MKPPLIVVAPVKLLVPVSVRMPVPVFVIEPVPEMTPAYVVLSLLPPMVRVAAPNVTLPLVVPPPDNEPIETLNPVMSITVPAVLERLTAEPLPKALATPALRVPTLMMVGPV